MSQSRSAQASNQLVAKGASVAITYLANTIDEIRPELLDDITTQELQNAVRALRVALERTVTDAKRRHDNGQLYFDPNKKR